MQVKRRRILDGPLDPKLMNLEVTDPKEQAERGREEIYKALGVRPQPPVNRKRKSNG